jgi:hypothetical protein
VLATILNKRVGEMKLEDIRLAEKFKIFIIDVYFAILSLMN